MVRIPWGKDRIGYRCTKEGDHYGRIVDTQLPQANPLLIRPAWCNEKEMGTKSTELRAALKAANLPYGNVRECARQLFDIVKDDEQLCSIVLEDLAAGKTVQNCEKEIEKFAKSHKGVDGYDAEVIIRKFFGLPDADPRRDIFDEDETPASMGDQAQEETAFSLSDFL